METCGILGGTLDAKRGLFSINLLVVPKQKGSTDMVEMLNEEEILDAFDSRTPHHYPLGWIHTHPAFTCFLSSIDMHTQCPYQVSSSPCTQPLCSRLRCACLPCMPAVAGAHSSQLAMSSSSCQGT